MQQYYGNDNPDAIERIFQGSINRMNLLVIGINVVVYIDLEYLGNTEDTVHMLKYGAAYTPWILEGDWYRLFTSMFLHFGFEHLLNNMILLLFMGDMVEELVGKWKYLIIYLGGGIVGNLLSFACDLKFGDNSVSAGASGAIYAVLGGFLIILLKNRGKIEDITASRVFIVIILTVYNGLQSTGIDNAAHIGGLIGGMFWTLLLYRKKEPDQFIVFD